MKFVLIAISYVLVGFLVGCSEPDSTHTYSSPSPLISIVVEEFGGDGPLNPDFTRVYVVRKTDNKYIGKLILD